jgi:hypothetical protein
VRVGVGAIGRVAKFVRVRDWLPTNREALRAKEFPDYLEGKVQRLCPADGIPAAMRGDPVGPRNVLPE